MGEEKKVSAKAVKKTRKKLDCQRLKLYPLKPEEVIKAVLSISSSTNFDSPEPSDKTKGTTNK